MRMLNAPHYRFAIPASGLAHVFTLNEMTRWVKEKAYVPQMQCGRRLQPRSASKTLQDAELCRGCELAIKEKT